MPAGIMPSPAAFYLPLASSRGGIDVSLAGNGAGSQCTWQPISNVPTMTGEVGIGKCIDVLFILIKTGKYFSVVTAEQLLDCAGKTAFW